MRIFTFSPPRVAGEGWVPCRQWEWPADFSVRAGGRSRDRETHRETQETGTEAPKDRDRDRQQQRDSERYRGRERHRETDPERFDWVCNHYQPMTPEFAIR